MHLVLLSGCLTMPGTYQRYRMDVLDSDKDGFVDAEWAEDYAGEFADGRPDCDDEDPAVNPAAQELPYNGIDDDCDAGTSDTDADGDGFDGAEVGGGDCDDTDASVHPEATETWYDGTDQDCDGNDADQDGDGLSVDDDCDDTDEAIGDPDSGYSDADGDGYGDVDQPEEACPGTEGVVADSSDCDDGDAEVHPGAAEVCEDGVDNDCDASTDCRWSSGTAALGEKGTAGSSFGEAIAAADVDGDGAVEMAVGAWGASGGDGCIYLFAATPSSLLEEDFDCEGSGLGWGFGLSAGDVDLDGRDELVVYRKEGDSYLVNPRTWARVASFGDVDGDTIGRGYLMPGLSNVVYPDLVFARVLQGEAGAVYVFEGGEAGWSGDHASSDADRVIQHSSVTEFGEALLAVDLDGAGRNELLISDASQGAGKVFAFAHDAEGTQASADFSLKGSVNGDYFGMALAAGDFDDDGYEDLVVGAPLATEGSAESGAAYLFLGPLTGDRAADTTLSGDGGSGFGRSIASGDFQGDGQLDLAVGAPLADDLAGGAAVFYGPISAGTWLAAGSPGDLLGSAALTGDFDGNGSDDLALSGLGADRVWLLLGEAY